MTSVVDISDRGKANQMPETSANIDGSRMK